MKESIKKEIEYCKENGINKLTEASKEYLLELRDVKGFNYVDMSWLFWISKTLVKLRFEELGIGDAGKRYFIEGEEVFSFSTVRSKINKGKLKETQLCEIVSFSGNDIVIRDRYSHTKYVLKLEELSLP